MWFAPSPPPPFPMSSEENIDTPPQTPGEMSTPKFNESTLLAMAQTQAEKTASFWGKLVEFAKIVVFRQPNAFEQSIVEIEPNDSAFISKFSVVKTVDLSHITSVSVDSVTLHTLHSPHPLVNFAKEEPLTDEIIAEVNESPAIVFIHGMGGQMSQFDSLMGLLSQCSEIFSLDLPGFGDSRIDFAKCPGKFTQGDRDAISSSIRNMAWSDFQTDNIVAIIVAFINQNVPAHKKVILVGHSMGTHLSAKVANKLEKSRVEGLVFLSPPAFKDDVSNAEPVPPNRGFKALNVMGLFSVFPFLFDLFRVWDRLEGLTSTSVLRQLPTESSLYMKLRQLRWNLDIDTRVLLRYVKGFTPCKNSELANSILNFNNNQKDPKTYEKTLIIGGLEDKVTPVSILSDINDFLWKVFEKKVVQVTTVKSAGHSILLAKPEFISGLILNHLESQFPERLHLSPAWVLKLKADISGDKWGLKNELKWSKTQSISHDIIRRGNERATLLGMKTLREGDPNHSPTIVEGIFYGDGPSVLEDGTAVQGKLIAIVDISTDIPPYSPKSFQHVKYYKCATVSKVVPDSSAVRRFIQLIDDILSSSDEEDPLVAVHCHYGFNRTGFLICCYLIERCGWSVKEAVEGFRAAKSPGIKHPHFIDALYVKYE